MTLEENANMAAGRPSKIPPLPAIVRPLVRIFFNRIVRTGNFPKAKANAALTPAHGPATAAEARARLEGALAKFEAECGALAAARRRVPSGGFGLVPVEDCVRFHELHARHHIKQIPVSP